VGRFVFVVLAATACNGIIGLDGYRPCNGDECDAGVDAADTGAAYAFCAPTVVKSCGGSTLDQCTDFESGLGWTPFNQNTGAVAIDTTTSCRGTKSLHATVGNTTASGARGDVYETQTFVSGTKSIWMRAFVYLPSASASKTALFLFAADSQGGNIVGVGANAGFVQVENNVASHTRVSQTAFPVDRWTCLELELAPNATSVSLDDVQVTDLSAAEPTSPSASAGIVGAGIIANGNAPAEVWIDNVAVSAKAPIGCAN